MMDYTPTSLDATRHEHGFIGLDQNGPIFAAPEITPAGRMAAAADGPGWWPRASRNQLAPEDGGSILDGYPEKGLLHTTETATWPGYGSGYFPHLTVMVGPGERFYARQHIPFTRAGRALRNEPGGVQTNRVTRCQVEIVTRADVVDTYGLHPAMVDGLADLAEWLRVNWGVPRTCSVTFKPYPSSYGKGNGVRLSPSAWERYAGWLGHQHAPENDHGDPGALDWRPILLQSEEDLTMDDATRAYLDDQFRLVRVGDVQGGAVDTHDFSSLEGVGRQVKALDAKVGTLGEKVDALIELLGPVPPA
jgi:hypothetical protein